MYGEDQVLGEGMVKAVTDSSAAYPEIGHQLQSDLVAGMNLEIECWVPPGHDYGSL